MTVHLGLIFSCFLALTSVFAASDYEDSLVNSDGRCFEHDIHYIGSGLNKPGGDNNYGLTGSAEGCQILCSNTEGCAWFNWEREEDQCWLKAGKGDKTKQIPGGVTGPESCLGCLTGKMAHIHGRVIMVCENSATFIGENHHELWWDPLNKYWFCGMGYRQGMKELNENGVTLPFNLSSTEDRVFYKTELPRKTILPKDEINVRLEYALDSNNTYYSYRRDMIIIIVEGRNDPMALAPGSGDLKWEIKYGHYVDLEVDIRFNITGLN